jgi:tetratricopeptide (TPR) repeat protein
MNSYRADLLTGLALALAASLVYWPACSNAFVNFDDPVYVYENEEVLGGPTTEGVRWAFTTTHGANWHPLTWLSLQLDAMLFGSDPFGFHLTNVFLHALNTCLLFCFLRVATGRRWPSAFVAGLFALHPLHVESVAWVAERKDVLSTLFWMLTLLAYLWYARSPNVLRYLAVVTALGLGLLAKPMLVTLPCVLLLLDYWPLRRSERPVRLVLEKLPLFVLVAGSCAVTLYAQKAGGAVASLESLGPLQRVCNALVAYVAYLRKAIWPADLAVYYPHDGQQQPPLPVLAAMLVLGLVSWLCLRAYRTRPYLAVGWLWFLGTLVPVIGLVQVGQQALADRYAYIPLIGMYLICAWGIADLAQRYALLRPLVAGVSLAVLVGCALGSRVQLAYWHDSGTLWERSIAVAAPCQLAHGNLAAFFLKQGDEDKALYHYQKRVRIAPGLKTAQYTVAALLEKHGRLDEAEKHYREALRLDPNYVLVQTALAGLDAKLGRVQQSLDSLEKILRQDPDNALAQLNYGLALEKRGQVEGALVWYRKALRTQPNLQLGHYNLGSCLGKQGKFDEAIVHLREAVRLWPQHAQAHENLGHALEGKGEHGEALASYREATRLAPRSAHARLSLAAALLHLGRKEEALAEYRNALRLDPQWPVRYGREAWALATHPDPKKRDRAEAVALAEEVCVATDNTQPGLLDTLAAAYASAGRFTDATATARRALDLARSANLKTLIGPLEERLKLYQSGRPFLDSSLQ